MNYRYLKGSEDTAESVEFDVAVSGSTCIVNVQRLLYGIRSHTLADGERFDLSDQITLEVLEVVKKERDAIKYSGKPKTLEKWMGSGLNLCEYLSVGDEVDEELVDNMMNCVPPHRLKYGYLQIGEAYADAFDESEGIKRYRATYGTFHKKSIEGRCCWVYAGNCFSDETVNRLPEKDVAGGMLQELKCKLG